MPIDATNVMHLSLCLPRKHELPEGTYTAGKDLVNKSLASPYRPAVRHVLASQSYLATWRFIPQLIPAAKCTIIT